MFELVNVENKVWISIEVLGYQFPESPEDNWCFLNVKVTQGNEQFEKTDPAVETTELVEMYEWFKCLSKRVLPKCSHLTFIEPCISLEFLSCSKSTVRIAIILDHELKPGFDIEQFGSKNSNWDIVFELSGSHFKNILQGIETQILKYPNREKC